MPTDDEFRRVAEDVRALARSLARDIRAVVEEARGGPPPDGEVRHDPFSAAGRATRDELRRARMALRQAARSSQYRRCSFPDPTQPRWDNWGRPRHGSRGQGEPGPGSGDPAIGSDLDESATGSVGLMTDPGGPGHPGGPGGPGGPRRLDRHARRPPPPAPLPLRHRHDGSTLLGLLAVVFGLAWLATQAGVVNVSAEAVLAMALMVLGVGMVITARTDWALSRRSWPVMAGAVLLVALIASSSSPSLATDLRHLQFGRRTFSATAWADVPATYKGSVGETLVDLSAIHDPLPAPRTFEVDGAAGRLVVQLPANLAVILDARLGAGDIMVNGTSVASGFRPSYNRPLDLSGGATAGAGPALTLKIRSGVGAVRILGPAGSATSSAASPLTPSTPLTPLTPKEPAPPVEPKVGGIKP